MISEFFINAGFGIADRFLSLLPDMTWSVDTTAWQYLKDFLDMVCYILPLETVIDIGSLIVTLSVFRICIAIIRAIKGFIPFV